MKLFKDIWILGLVAMSLAASAQNFKIRKTDFASLYNDFRFSQPANVPWSGSYFAYAKDGISVPLATGSPAAKYDKVFSPKESAEAWEKENHTCAGFKGEEKKSCEGWWGHCNAWSAAAIKELEPRQSLNFRGTSIEVADQKAWLTEMWMDSGSLFVGNTSKSVPTGKWVLNPTSSTARKLVSGDGSETNYDAFWDVTPKTFFMTFTNYVGVLKQGVVIDRFTGDEVWNQPIVGYRILPISKSDILAPITNENGATIYPVKLSVKIYWANDEVDEGHVSIPFDISQTSDSLQLDHLPDDYAVRLLQFKLFFDKPLEMMGAQVVRAGRVVGDGIWAHQEDPSLAVDGDLNQTHPDFIWAPLELDQTSHESSNPCVDQTNVREVIDGIRSGPVTPELDLKQQMTLSLDRSAFGLDADGVGIQKSIRFVLEREGIRSRIRARDVTVDATMVNLKLYYPSSVSSEKISSLLAEAGFKLR